MMQINVLNYNWLHFVGVTFQDSVTFHYESGQMIYISDADKCTKLEMS